MVYSEVGQAVETWVAVRVAAREMGEQQKVEGQRLKGSTRAIPEVAASSVLQLIKVAHQSKLLTVNDDKQLHMYG